jgi:uncharacterized protein YjbI with pentapeptide repeats
VTVTPPRPPVVAPERRELSLEADELDLTGAELVGGDASGAALRELSLVDSRLDRCNLANVEARSAAWIRVEVEGSRMTGLSVPEALLRDVRIRDTRLDLAVLRFARLERVVFEDCRLEGADFYGARLESVAFRRCDLGEASFADAKLRETEFRRCTLTGLTGAAALRGAEMEWNDVVENAPLWAAALGIRVVEPDGAEGDRG